MAVLDGRLLHDVGGVVRRQHAHQRALQRRIGPEQQVRLIARVHAEKHRLGLGVRQQRQAFEPFSGGEDRPGVTQLRRGEADRMGSLLGGSRHDAEPPPLAPRTGGAGRASVPGAIYEM